MTFNVQMISVQCDPLCDTTLFTFEVYHSCLLSKTTHNFRVLLDLIDHIVNCFVVEG